MQDALYPELKPIEIDVEAVRDMTVDEIKQMFTDVLREVHKRVNLFGGAEIQFKDEEMSDVH